MKYHIVSTSKSGHGAIFTNAKEAQEYHKKHPGSVCHKGLDRLPTKIPPIGSITAKPVAIPKTTGEITIYTDGSALGNPGLGGYGVVILINGETRELSQGYEYTTNNRMEMMAVIKALETLKKQPKSAITIHSDSQQRYHQRMV